MFFVCHPALKLLKQLACRSGIIVRGCPHAKLLFTGYNSKMGHMNSRG